MGYAAALDGLEVIPAVFNNWGAGLHATWKGNYIVTVECQL